MCRNNNHTQAQKYKRDTATHCAYCNHKLYDEGHRKRTIDHFFPVSKDVKNLNRGWNKLVCCKSCNHIKADKNPEQFLAYLQKQLNKSGHTPQYIQDTKDIINNVSRYYDELLGWYIMRDLI